MASGNNSSGDDRFQTTRWSVVARAQDPNAAEARTALTELCQAYWYPLYAFIRRQTATTQEAEDLTQSFFVHLLEKNVLAVVDRHAGKFRAFLLTCCKHFLANQRDQAQSVKRGAGKASLSLDFVLADQRYQREPIDPVTPEAIYERRWAMILLEQTLQRLQQEFEQSGKEELYQHLQPVLTGAPDAARYAQIAAALHMTEGTVKKNVQRLRERYGQLLRAAIAVTLESEEQIDEELQALFAILASPQNSRLESPK